MAEDPNLEKTLTVKTQPLSCAKRCCSQEDPLKRALGTSRGSAVGFAPLRHGSPRCSHCLHRHHGTHGEVTAAPNSLLLETQHGRLVRDQWIPHLHPRAGVRNDWCCLLPVQTQRTGWPWTCAVSENTSNLGTRLLLQ